MCGKNGRKEMEKDQMKYERSPDEITGGRMVSKMTRRRMAQERREGKEGKTEGSVKGGLRERCEEE